MVEARERVIQAPTWVDSSTNDSPQRIPCSVIKPIVEAVEPFFGEIASRSVIKVPAADRGC